jgi:predicted lipoprotein with Yx(FWY)xxD motif
MRPRLLSLLPAVLALVLAACSASPGSSASPSASPTAVSTPAATATPAATSTATPTAAPSAPAQSGDTVKAASVGSLGTVLVAGTNGMTVYTFDNDVKDSGTSACTGACLARWPALTIPAGTTPTGGDGVSGTLATILRSDDGTTQVTYNGLPLYFFSGDAAPGDANGVYTGWRAVSP